ncbi:hypothetical protein EDB83DRAFT_2399031 [Lactarius deliciosus]|nr:hypothetical protein EDB83DRAFT_2399031 [Lactarius deliciosus]
MSAVRGIPLPASPRPPSPTALPPQPSTVPHPHPLHPPTNEEIDAVIQQATSSISSDGRHVPLKDTRTQLFVGNLPYRVRWQDLKDLFRKAGTVLRADVSLGPDNRSRGYGTVLLATAEDAGRAVDMFNGYSWQSRVLEVRLDRLPCDFDNLSNPTSGYHTPVLINGHAQIIPGLRPPFTFTAPLSPSFNPLSSFVTHIPLRNTLDEPHADNIIPPLGHDRPMTAGGISRNLFVGNLPFHCQWQDLKDLFRQAGTILRADVALGQDGRSRGFGTVVFATEFDAERAVNMFNGYEYNGRPLKVHYDKFMPSMGQSMTAPSSPLLASPFPSVSAASLASIANCCYQAGILPWHPTTTAQPLEYNAYGMHHKMSTSPPPINALSSLPRAQPQAVLPRLSAVSEQQLLARFSSSLSVDDAINLAKHESPPADNRDLPTPPSSSAGAQSMKGSRVSSPPLQLPQPIHSFSQPSLKQAPPPPPPQPHAKSAPPPLTLSSPPAPVVQPESHYSTQGSISSSQREAPPLPDQTSPSSWQRAHPAHPGPISLPPPSTFVIPAPHNFSPVSPMFAPPGIHVSPLHHPGVPPLTASHVPAHSPLSHPMHARSPLHHPAHGHPFNMTPIGLPPITPSMPSFQFVPGPPPPTHPSHPPAIFSPASTMSPGAFWGRPGGNTLTNAAVGAPVTMGKNEEEIDYFASASTAGEGYFPPLPQAGSGLAREILRDESESASGNGERQAASGPTTENGPDREEMSTSSGGSSGRSSAGERIGGVGIDGVHSGVYTSLPRPGGIPRSEEQLRARGQGELSSPPLQPPPMRRKIFDPMMQERGTHNHNSSFAQLVQDAGAQSS